MGYKLHWKLEQRSPEWHAVRENSIGGTGSYDLLRIGDKQRCLNYLNEKAEQNKRFRNYVSPSAQWGNDNEPIARDYLEQILRREGIINGKDVVTEVGAITRDDIQNVHHSPDLIVVDESDMEKETAPVKILGELKCFQMEHSWAIWEGGIDEKIICQIQWGLFLLDITDGWFCLYCPMMLDERQTPDGKRHPERVLFIKKVERDEDYMNAFRNALGMKK